MANWGFLGAGSIAASSLGPAVHAADGAVLHAVAAGSRTRAEALRPAKTYPSYDDLLRDPDVDVVYIALHNSAHRPWVERALRAGKHVLCEKPLGLTAAEVDAMVDTARDTGRLLVEAAWNRWHPRTRDLEALIDSGAAGEVRSVISRFDGTAPAEGNYRLDPALGGGALYDVGYYAVAAALAAFGWQTPQVIRAEQDQWHPHSADSRSAFLLAFPGGGTADVHCALDGAPGTPFTEELTITGTKGTLRMPPPAFCAGAAPSRLTGDAPGTDRAYPAVDPYRLMVEAMNAAADGTEPTPYLVPWEQSRLIAATLEAVREACRPHAARVPSLP